MKIPDKEKNKYLHLKEKLNDYSYLYYTQKLVLVNGQGNSSNISGLEATKFDLLFTMTFCTLLYCICLMGLCVGFFSIPKDS